MSTTKQGAFDTVYHHIDAPTNTDEAYGREHKKRRLIIPTTESDLWAYRSPVIYQLALTPWSYKRKLDGENLRVQWDGEQALWNGKSNAFQCGAALTEYMNETFLEEIFEEEFGRTGKVWLFGEHMGPKSQGNELGLEKTEFVLYDVCVNGFWLDPSAVSSIAKDFGVHSCYDFMPDGSDDDTLLGLIQRVANGSFKDWEGIVATPKYECRDMAGNRVIVKIKNRDYLRADDV